MSDAARARAAAALRRLGHALHAHDPDPSLLERVADAADRVAAQVATSAVRTRDLDALKQQMWREPIGEGHRIDHFDDCFVSGEWNPLGIGVHVEREGDEAVARVTLGPAFEGAPGRAHGGIVAAIFDDVLGCLLRIERTPAFTGELSVRYLAPTPVGDELVVRARTVGREGRKLDTEGECTARTADGTTVTVATATARFITIDAYVDG